LYSSRELGKSVFGVIITISALLVVFRVDFDPVTTHSTEVREGKTEQMDPNSPFQQIEIERKRRINIISAAAQKDVVRSIQLLKKWNTLQRHGTFLFVLFFRLLFGRFERVTDSLSGG
jgi:hypothetical protein